MIAGVALGADANDAVAVVRQAAHVGFGALKLGEDATGRFQHAAACGREHEPASDAQEERCTEAPFDIPKLVAEGRLGEKQAVGRPGHAAGVGNLRDEPQVANLEVHPADPNT